MPLIAFSFSASAPNFVSENPSHKVTIPKLGAGALKAYRRKPVWVLVFFRTQRKNNPVAYAYENSLRKWL